MSSSKDNYDNQISWMSDFAEEAKGIEEEKSADTIEELIKDEFSENYEIGDVIATGGIKVIRSVKDCRTGRTVAMATLKDECRSLLNIERFLREARILATLEHSNIVPIYEININDSNNLYFTMKLLEGETLSSIIKNLKNGEPEYLEKYPFKKLLDIFLKSCEAVSYAHSKDTVHLDIKPENIQISIYGEISVIDWGLAKKKDEAKGLHYVTEGNMESATPSTTLTQAGSIVGTPAYMSPEQTDKDSSEIGKQSDIYSLGATLYALLYRQHPYQGMSIGDIILKKQQRKAAEFPSTVGDRKIPVALKAITQKAMAAKPEERYDNIAELMNDIDLYLNDFSTQAENISIPKILYLFFKRHSTACLVALSAFIIIALISWFSINSIREKEEKIIATTGEVTSGIIKKEMDLRNAGKHEEAISEYEKLIKLGYNNPMLKLRLARLYAGALELKKSLTLLKQIEESGSEIIHSRDFYNIRPDVEKFLNMGLTPRNNSHAAEFTNRKSGHIKHHVFMSINKIKGISLEERMQTVKENLLRLNPQVRNEINFKYSADERGITLDLSGNKTLTEKAPIIGLKLYALNLNDTNIGLDQFVYYKSIQNYLKILEYNNFKNSFTQTMLNRLKLDKLILKNGRYAACNLRMNPHLLYLDIEGAAVSKHFWDPSTTLEYLNIAFSNFDQFSTLPRSSGLKRLIIDKSQKIPKEILNTLKEQGVDITTK